MTDLFTGPVGYGSDRFEGGTEYAREKAELDAMTLQPGEKVCPDCWTVHPAGRCDR